MWPSLICFLGTRTGPLVVVGTAQDFARHIQRLLDAPDGSSLIVEVQGLEDAFLQLTAGPDVIQIDQPLITQGQVGREAALRRELTIAGFTPYVTLGSDGTRFLDCDVPRDAAAAALLVNKIFGALFEINPTSQLRFTGNGLLPEA